MKFFDDLAPETKLENPSLKCVLVFEVTQCCNYLHENLVIFYQAKTFTFYNIRVTCRTSIIRES